MNFRGRHSIKVRDRRVIGEESLQLGGPCGGQLHACVQNFKLGARAGIETGLGQP